MGFTWKTGETHGFQVENWRCHSKIWDLTDLYRFLRDDFTGSNPWFQDGKGKGGWYWIDEFWRVLISKQLRFLTPISWQWVLIHQLVIGQWSKARISPLIMTWNVSISTCFLADPANVERQSVAKLAFLIHLILWSLDIAIENCHRNSWFYHWKWWFSIANCKRLPVYQRQTHLKFMSSQSQGMGNPSILERTTSGLGHPFFVSDKIWKIDS